MRAAAEQLDASLLVVGASHRGRFGRVLPGGVAERLLHTAPCALAVAPRNFSGSTNGIGRIGVAFVDTAEGREALAAAAAMAVLGGATLSICTVLDPPAASDAERRASARAVVDRAVASVPTDVLAEVELLDGDAGHALAAASAELDLLVCGSRGFGRLLGTLVGGVSGTLAHSCACPLIVLPRERHGAVRSSRHQLAEDSQGRPEMASQRHGSAG